LRVEKFRLLRDMKLSHSYYVYIVQCRDGLYYTGVTNDVDRRIAEHNSGVDQGCFTYIRRPVQLKYTEHFQNIEHAIAWEKQLKGWSRKKKEALLWEIIRPSASWLRRKAVMILCESSYIISE